MSSLTIQTPTGSDIVNIALDTLRISKQSLVFVGTKPSAEKCAEDISRAVDISSPELDALSLDVLHALTKPTKQCERLARCLKKGIAFHHSGLTHKQRAAVEAAFKSGLVKIICCTPTLAAGLDLPAYRAVIRDLRRFGDNGMGWIPVLEYLQMAGRAGRPKYDTEGQAIITAGTSADKDNAFGRYVMGSPEEIYSKLAVEPALRTYLLSLIASRFVKSKKEILDFFADTFWAHQFGDMPRLEAVLMRMLGLLNEWGFITSGSDFVGADELGEDSRVSATHVGKRVAELYLDPLTAHHLILCMANWKQGVGEFPLMLMFCSTIEMRPLLRAGTRDHEAVQDFLLKFDGRLLQDEPSMFEDEHVDFINGVKTAMFFNEWIAEKDEGFLLEKYNVRPGEIHSKLDTGDWLLYSALEICRLVGKRELLRELARLRLRIRYGVKEELLPLLKLKGIGRVRARRLYANKITDIGAIKSADMAALSQILGPKLAQDVKGQVGQKTFIEKEQMSLDVEEGFKLTSHYQSP